MQPRWVADGEHVLGRAPVRHRFTKRAKPLWERSHQEAMRLATTILFFCVAALLALGMVMLFSASTEQPEAKYLFLQPIWCSIGLAACWLVSAGNYRWLKRYPWITCLIFALSLSLLVVVLVSGIGTKINGARRWLRAGSFSFQPSEFAKIALIIALAYYGDRYQRYVSSFWRGFVLPGLIIAPVLGLVFIEPDWGTTILLAAVSGMLLYIAGTRARYLLVSVLMGSVGLVIFVLNNAVRMKRILAFLYPEENKEEVGYQTYQAMVAIGSGGVAGVGLGDGRQKLGFVPEHHTDFIFSVIGEELGLVATVLVILAFMAIVICGLYIAWNSRDTFGMLLGSGITFLIGFQAVINIGVVTGSLPNKGLSLPFISYGGSNLIIMLACVGLLINIARQTGQSHAVSPSGESAGLGSPQLS
jgi:cell division protein FtsW